MFLWNPLSTKADESTENWDSGESSLRIVAWDPDTLPIITSPATNVSSVSKINCSFLRSNLCTIPDFPVFVVIFSLSKNALKSIWISNIGKVFSAVILIDELSESMLPG